MNLDYKFMISDFPTVLKSLPITLELTLWTMLFAIIIGIVFGIVILQNIPILKQIILAINTFIKGVPLVIQLLFCYYAFPYLLENLNGFLLFKYDPRNIPYFWSAVVALAVNFGAYITDVVVSSMRAVDKGQLEACYSVGMTNIQGMITIVIPQAVIISIPNMTNYFIWILKATSIASVVNVVEMLTTARISASDGYQYMEAYLVAAAIYWIVCIVFEWSIRHFNGRAQRYNKKLTVG